MSEVGAPYTIVILLKNPPPKYSIEFSNLLEFRMLGPNYTIIILLENLPQK